MALDLVAEIVQLIEERYRRPVVGAEVTIRQLASPQLLIPATKTADHPSQNIPPASPKGSSSVALCYRNPPVSMSCPVMFRGSEFSCVIVL